MRFCRWFFQLFFAGGLLLDLSQVMMFSCWAASDCELMFHSVFGYKKFIVSSTMNCVWRHFSRTTTALLSVVRPFSTTAATFWIKHSNFYNQWITNWKSQVYLHLLLWDLYFWCALSNLLFFSYMRLNVVDMLTLLKLTFYNGIILNDLTFYRYISKILQFCWILHIMLHCFTTYRQPVTSTVHCYNTLANHMAAFKKQTTCFPHDVICYQNQIRYERRVCFLTGRPTAQQ